MKRKEFKELDDERVIWNCVEPAISKVRGKSGAEKLQVFCQLSDGQRALFMFQVLHGHMEHGINGFYDHISYLADQMDIWLALKSGMRFFGADEMYELTGKMEQGYVLRAEGHTDKELMDEINEIYRRLISALVKGIADRIRSDPEAFIRFED